MPEVTKEQFLADVLAEIEALKIHTLPEEVERLNIVFFDPTLAQQCIYGQMTGNCCSLRARDLMDKCCKRQAKRSGSLAFERESLDKVIEGDMINGEYDGSTWKFDTWFHERNYDYMSALETYILTREGREKTEEIINYLKGQQEEIIL